MKKLEGVFVIVLVVYAIWNVIDVVVDRRQNELLQFHQDLLDVQARRLSVLEQGPTATTREGQWYRDMDSENPGWRFVPTKEN